MYIHCEKYLYWLPFVGRLRRFTHIVNSNNWAKSHTTVCLAEDKRCCLLTCTPLKHLQKHKATTAMQGHARSVAVFILQNDMVHIGSHQIMLPGLLAMLPLCRHCRESSTAPALLVCA